MTTGRINQVTIFAAATSEGATIRPQAEATGVVFLELRERTPGRTPDTAKAMTVTRPSFSLSNVLPPKVREQEPDKANRRALLHIPVRRGFSCDGHIRELMATKADLAPIVL